MQARRLFLLALTLAGVVPLAAQEPAVAPTPVTTSVSNEYSEVSCTTSDAAACADALQLAADTRDALGQLLRLGSTWRFPVHIHVVTADDPLAGKIKGEAAQVLLVNGAMTIDAYLPLDDPLAREFIQRQYVTALVWEKFFAGMKKFDQDTPLDRVPLWLVEGLREWVNEDPTHNREQIVHRALQNNVAPALAQVTGWKSLGPDRLFGLWQRAFSFYLVDSLVRVDPHRGEFQDWLDRLAASPDAKAPLPTEADWQQELADASARSHGTIYTWQETYEELEADETISYAESKDAKVQSCAIDDVALKAPTTGLLQAVKDRIDVLTQLERRAHPGWTATLEAYRKALTALLDDKDISRTPRLLAEARALQGAEVENHQKLLDYLNWFEVTRDAGDSTGRYEGYFRSAKEVDDALADPAHPNPIRASVLQVESHL